MDFIPWVRPESSQPPDLKEEEEEEMKGLLDRYAARKWKRQEDATQEADSVLDQAVGSSQYAAGGSSEERKIIISSFPKTGSSDRPDIGDDVLGKAVPAPPALQTILPPVQVGSQPGRSEFTPTRLKRLKPPERIITNSYLPARGPTPQRRKYRLPGWKMLNTLSVRL